jgi:hypothetical protein
VGVDQPGFPEAIGETKLILLSTSKYARCSDRLIITLVPGPKSEALMKPIVAWTGGTAVIRWWLAQPVAKDPIKMLISTNLSIFDFPLTSVSDNGLVEIERSDN